MPPPRPDISTPREQTRPGGSRGSVKVDYSLVASDGGATVAVDADTSLSGAITQFGRTGLVEEMHGDDLDKALGDFWTGTACPENATLNPGGQPVGNFDVVPPKPAVSNQGQPHCPVSLVAIYPSS